jgi:hypothetical protein
LLKAIAIFFGFHIANQEPQVTVVEEEIEAVWVNPQVIPLQEEVEAVWIPNENYK